MNGEQATSNSLIGAVLLGRYRIVRELAKGGMGVVYLARAEGAVGFVKPYVIKLVLPEHADNQRFIQMFVREANILSNLRHPGIVSVIELGEREEDGALVMVLEYVRGYHLGQWAKYVRLKKRAIPVEILLQLMIEVLDALHYAHTMVHPDGAPMYIVHRDISPSNILLDEDGRGRLLDFGVARMRGGNQEYHTQVKGFVGKLMYSAPELFAEAEATAQSDCYSCAVVLHEVLIGRNVFRGDNQAATLNRVLNHMPELIEPLRQDIPPGLDAILQKALSKASRDRYGSAREFAAALRSLQTETENDVRARFAVLLKEDFGQDMSEMLGLESLADRDEAWRRLSHYPTRVGGVSFDFELGDSGERQITNRPRPPQNTLRGMPVDQTAVRVPRRSSNGLRKEQESARVLAVPPPPPPSASVRPPPPTVASIPTQSATTLIDPFRANGGARTLRGFFAGVVVAGGVITAMVLALQHGRAANATTSMPQIRVVTEEPAYDEPTSPTTPRTEADAGASASTTDSPPRPHQERRDRSAQPDPMSLTRAVRKQQVKIETCFTAHAAAVKGMPMMQLEFDLAASGKLEAVRVLPKMLGATPLGKCLEKVAAATHFPPQSRPISFAIPITASRSATR